MKRNSLQANILLLITAVIWGGGFVAQRMGMEQIGPFLFNACRFFVGALVLVPLMIFRKPPPAVRGMGWKQTAIYGAAAGLFLFAGATFQQLGLVHSTAGKAGFITGLYVIIVPLLGMLWGDRAPAVTWLGAGLAVVGLYLLSANRGLQFAPGDGLILLGAVFWAGHVQFLAQFAPRLDALKLSFVQSLVTALISFGVSLLTEFVYLGQILAAAGPILYGGVISIGLAYTFQIIAQQSARPTPAAIILSLESVFAAFWGWLILGEILSPRALGGSLLMLAGMMVSQAGPAAGTWLDIKRRGKGSDPGGGASPRLD